MNFELQTTDYQQITITSQTSFESELFNITNHFEKISQWFQVQVLLSGL